MTSELAAEAASETSEASETCERCGKPLALCICDSIEPFDHTVEVVILQHPQEQDRALGTARLTALHFKNAVLKIGLSWPSLTKVLGRSVDPQRWAVLYLGSLKAADGGTTSDITVLNKKGEVDTDHKTALRGIQGIILLDGTWSQAKALWWRNAWMLKCRRVILRPRTPSRYGNLRREPRAEGLSTLEAAAMLVSRLDKRPDIEVTLLQNFERLLQRYREVKKTTPGFDRSKERSKGGRFRSAKQTHRRLRRS